MLAINQETVSDLAAWWSPIDKSNFSPWRYYLQLVQAKGSQRARLPYQATPDWLWWGAHRQVWHSLYCQSQPCSTPDVSISVPSHDGLTIPSVHSCSIPCRPRSCPSLAWNTPSEFGFYDNATEPNSVSQSQSQFQSVFRFGTSSTCSCYLCQQ
jgi:hypothetical protein